MAAAALALAGALIASGLTADQSQAKKAKNPLAGHYSGTSTNYGFPLSFTITKSGAVLGFAPTFPLGLASGTAADPTLVCYPSQSGGQICQFPCPGSPTGIVSAPNLRLSKPVPGFPKGKKIDYQGPGGNPAGTVKIKGKPEFGAGNRFTGRLTGQAGLTNVQSGTQTCAGGDSWQATRVRR